VGAEYGAAVTVLLATFSLLPDGELGGERVVSALAERGIDSRWVVWDDASVDWAAADLVAVRSTWDYHRRTAEFLAWARKVESGTRLLNGADVFAWNADKAYLADLALDVPCVPTALLDDATLVRGLQEALATWGEVVVKPRTGAGGVGLVFASSLDDARLQGLTAAPWVVQPVVGSVRTTGETSVYVLGGRAVSQVDKVVAAGEGASEIRVHELYGGRSTPVVLGDEQAALAEAAVGAAARRWAADLSYARVDMMLWDGAWAVSELELIEPGLYLDVDPANADRFAELVRSLV
jgi:glutathione synthase/RimK-type ligase-like ATP-grasp enzyme